MRVSGMRFWAPLAGVAAVVVAVVALALVAVPPAQPSTVLAGDPSPLALAPAPASPTPASPVPAPSSSTVAPSSSPVPPTSGAVPPSSPSATAPPVASVLPCRTRELSGRLEFPPGRFNAAGHHGFLVLLTNSGTAPCSVLGFGTYALLDGTGRTMSAVQHNTVWSTMDTAVLAPGKPAYARVSYTSVATGDEPETGPCRPPSGGLRVSPPGDVDHLDLPLQLTVCDHGRLDVTQFAASDVF
ncbi:DUF4232 domain-containing protein [Lentzea sp. NPDC060358]|uniref:DUF4232 domain-containing protein n=1 Tax=Lentzea sp. NPDC060358 TaxID=3347103 RepID=UPI00364F01C6